MLKYIISGMFLL